MSELQSLRIDKWLWAIRAFKTRSLATEACRNGHVKVQGANAKPSKEVKRRDLVEVRQSGLHRTFRVVDLTHRRVAASKVPEFAADLTPPEAYQVHRDRRRQAAQIRPRGLGRPTKKERRQLEDLL